MHYKGGMHCKYCTKSTRFSYFFSLWLCFSSFIPIIYYSGVGGMLFSLTDLKTALFACFCLCSA